MLIGYVLITSLYRLFKVYCPLDLLEVGIQRLLCHRGADDDPIVGALGTLARERKVGEDHLRLATSRTSGLAYVESAGVQT